MNEKSKTRPLCRFCGKPIAKLTRSVYLRGPDSTNSTRYDSDTMFTLCVDKFPTTIDEARLLVRRDVISVNKNGAGQIFRFTDWDGETFIDRFFCKNACAMKFAYMILRDPKYSNLGTADYAIATQKGHAHV